MYKEQLSVSPNNIYLSLDFEKFKREIKTKYTESEDLGTVLLTKTKEYALSINNIGKVVILYNHLSISKLEELIDYIESVFKNTISSFQFDKRSILY